MISLSQTRTATTQAILVFVLLLFSLATNGELLRGGDFESTTFGQSGPWGCHGSCHLTASSDAHSGSHSVQVLNRHHNWEGIEQTVTLTDGGRYSLRAYVKVLNLSPGLMYTTVEPMVMCKDSTGKSIATKFDREPYARQDQWILVGGIHKLPSGVHSCSVTIRVSDIHSTYLVDDASLTSVDDIPLWRTEANDRIESLRKSNFTIRLSGGDPNADYDIELVQQKHKFGFGSAVGARQIVDPALARYQQVFYQNFEWAVLENALKWTQMERTQGQLRIDDALAALKALNASNIKIRAHNIFWAVKDHVPHWLPALNQAQQMAAMDKRIHDVVPLTKGYAAHWDVNNENIHGDYFEQMTGDPNITMTMFRDTHALDPDVKLFLNDFNVMQSFSAMPLRNQAKLFKDAGVPIYGVGIQSHLKHMNLDIPTLKSNLDLIAETGLPIWITELSFLSKDNVAKAQALQDVLTLYFSHPAVEGVLLWGFWDGKVFDPDIALFEGPNVTPNAAGLAYQQLFHTTWRTNVTDRIHGNGSSNVRGFQGVYKLTVKHGSKELAHQYFFIGKHSKTIDVNLDSVGGNVIIG
ncbi:anti-sigma-I factor RsgI6-like [Mya arenaria]|uniref:anti-sigma-I factor RsgI6-like n=1 Tax=Mya arenaria TaxID=6604 RepID=UPI0022E1F611|nr:anti-sigma-I factor RsgI6-like [Mya arenaria]